MTNKPRDPNSTLMIAWEAFDRVVPWVLGGLAIAIVVVLLVGIWIG